MDKEVFEKICKELEESWEGLSIICPRNGISRTSFYNWKENDDKLLDRYARARDMQMDYLEDLLFKVAMDEKGDLSTEDRVNTGANVIARAKLKVDTIKFVLGKLRSHKWGQKIEVTHIKEQPLFGDEE